VHRVVEEVIVRLADADVNLALQLRPQRLPDDQWELAQLPSGVPGTKKYVLKSRRAENYLQLDEEERFLWEQMDGRVSMQDIAVAYVMRYGSFDFEKIPQLIRKLLLADLLTLRPMSRLRDILALGTALAGNNMAGLATCGMLH